MNSAQDTPPNLAFYLPYGELLRTFLDQGFITPAEIRQVLRQRGIFLPVYEKAESIPYLAFATVTPREFEFLLEKQRMREESTKTINETLDWASAASIDEAMPSEEELAKFIEEQHGMKVTRISSVMLVNNNPNHVRIEYEIERTNLHKSWSTDRTPHRGELELQKSGSGTEATVDVISTIPETRAFGKKLLKQITNSFRLRGHVPFNSKQKKVHFACFDNQTRVKFLLSLTAPQNPELTFKAITDSDIAPDESSTLPKEIKPFLTDITKMALTGKNLQENILLKKPEYHEFVLLSGVTIRFNFDYHAAKGSCVAYFGFAGYPKVKALHDFETEIITITPDDPKLSNRRAVRRHVERLVHDHAREMSKPYLTEF